jgi:hypothetical protein
MRKSYYIGTTTEVDRLFAFVDLVDGELSITGVEGPKSNGDCRGSCGQCLEDWPGMVIKFAPGWDTIKLMELVKIWERWHLNDMRAGTPSQESYLREHPVSFTYPESHYKKALEALEAAGLQPDLLDGEPYSYGSAWLHEDLPAKVVETVESWVEGTQPPDAWAAGRN